MEPRGTGPIHQHHLATTCSCRPPESPLNQCWMHVFWPTSPATGGVEMGVSRGDANALQRDPGVKPNTASQHRRTS